MEPVVLHDATAFDADDLNGQSIASHDAVLCWFEPDSYDGTVTFQISPDGETWFDVQARAVSDLEMLVDNVASPSATDAYLVRVPGGCLLRAAMSSGSEGTLTVFAQATTFRG